MADQVFDSSHIPERYGLFTLIVLGESLVVVAAGAGEARDSTQALLVGAIGFGIAATVWWTYFDFVKSSSSLRRDRLLPSFVWGYGHLLVFAGVAAGAVGVELAIEGAAAGEALTDAARVAVAGGAAAYLVAITMIHAVSVRAVDKVVLARLAVTAFAIFLAVVDVSLTPLELTLPLLTVMVTLTLYETLLARADAHPAHGPDAPSTTAVA